MRKYIKYDVKYRRTLTNYCGVDEAARKTVRERETFW